MRPTVDLIGRSAGSLQPPARRCGAAAFPSRVVSGPSPQSSSTPIHRHWRASDLKRGVIRKGALPVDLDRNLVDSFEYGDRADEFGPVVSAVQARLDQDQGLRALGTSTLPAAGAPRLYVGSAVGVLAPPAAEESGSPADDFPPMVLHLERPSKAWQQAATSLMASQRLDYLLVVRVGVSQYPKGRRGLFAKNVLLGTGHEQPVKFLTAEDKLLEVLQVTGMLIDARGQDVRAGTEGILARDTPILAQSFEIAKLLDDEALRAAVSSERRQDLSGAPLSLEVAVDNLVGQLLKDPRRVLRPL